MRVFSAIFKDEYPFNLFGHKVVPVIRPSELDNKEPSFLVLHGGADISPSLYNQKPNKYTHATEEPSQRDIIEVDLAREAIRLGIPIFGICRGAQLATALAGGKLIQHVDNHAGWDHNIVLKSGKRLLVNSVHHQMCYPFDVPHELIGWANGLSPRYVGEDNKLVTVPENGVNRIEPEIFYLKDIKALCVQAHPEYVRKNDHDLLPFLNYTRQLINEYLVK